jgi:putative chitinase
MFINRVRVARRSTAVAVLGLAILAHGMPAQAVGASTRVAVARPAASSDLAPTPAGNTFPIPAPYQVRFSDDWHACRDGCTRQHKGNDLFAAEGTPAIAVESGVIASLSNSDTGNGGLSIWLRGDSGNAYFYAHNSANLVTEGQRVGRGQFIALVGHTGNATADAPHIHFQVNRCGRLDSSEPCTENPYEMLRSWPQELIDGGADAVGWYDPRSSAFYLRAEGGSMLPPTRLGQPGDVPFTGDWDGDGRDNLGLYRPSNATFTLLDAQGRPMPPIAFGIAGTDALPVAGDWNGDGRDSIGVYRRADATFYFRDDRGRVIPAISVAAPGSDLRPLAGDWDGDRRDGLALYRPADASFLISDDATGAAATPPTGGVPWPARFGQPGDLSLVGDWDGDGNDSVGVYHPADSTYHLEGFTDGAVSVPAQAASSVQLTSGVVVPAGPFVFGIANVPGAIPLAGDWNGRDLVTFDDLVAIFGPKVNKPVLLANLPFVNAAMARSGAVTPARKAAFLATLAHESGFRADAVQAGAATYRGRGFIQLTGEGNYRRAGADLGFDLVNTPGLAANPLVSAAAAGWYWTVARNINAAADRLDMGAVNIAVGYARTPVEDFERCITFVNALKWFNGGVVPDGVNCQRTPWSYLLALPPSPAPNGVPASGLPTLPLFPPSTTPPTTGPAPTTAPPTTDGPVSVPTTPPSSSAPTTAPAPTTTPPTTPPSTDGPVSVPVAPPSG